MNWNQFEVVLRNVKLEPLTQLTMGANNDTRHDNQTSDVLKSTAGTVIANTFDEIHDAVFQDDKRDFVWFKQGGTWKIRITGAQETPGHPKLARDGVWCAGELRANRISFKSGHFKTTRRHAVHYVADLIEQSCNGRSGVDRDNLVNQIASFPLVAYRSPTDHYLTDFTALVAALHYDQAPLVIHNIAPIAQKPKSLPQGWAPKPALNRTPTPPPTITSTALVQQDSGLTPPGQYTQAIAREGVRRWMPDTEASKCGRCNKSFSVLRRKHHCRNCGHIVCADCSKKKKQLANPIRRPGSTAPETGPVRVCDHCAIAVTVITATSV